MIFPKPFNIMANGCYAMLVKKHRWHKGKAHSATGYRPYVTYNSELWYAHRLSYHLNKEPISRKPVTLKSGIILHSCDNIWCINPDHLRIGTAKENHREALERNNKCTKARVNGGRSLWRNMTPEKKKMMSMKKSQTMTKICANMTAKKKEIISMKLSQAMIKSWARKQQIDAGE